MVMAMRICRLVLPVVLTMACGTEEPPHYVYPEAGVRKDASFIWPDYGNLFADLGSYRDSNSSDLPLDGSTPPGDGSQPSCPGPAAAKCVSPCASDEICTEAKGGTCVKAIVLSGAASDKAVLREVAIAYVRCWARAPADDLLCFALNTCQMTGTLTEKMVTDWVCQKAGVTDFPTPADHETAKGLCKCSWFWEVYRPDWKIGSVIAGQNGDVCLSYDKNNIISFDRLHVNACKYFPPL